MPLGGPFHELLAHGGELECTVSSGLANDTPSSTDPRGEILTQEHDHLPEAGHRPDLWASLVGEQVFP